MADRPLKYFPVRSAGLIRHAVGQVKAVDGPVTVTRRHPAMIGW
jgi:hypothetical protein